MNRTPLFDVAKFMVMLMVVCGHLTGNSIVMRGDGLWYGAFNVGVSMPLFFMISGYFAARILNDGCGAKVMARIVGFLWPLASFGFVFGWVLFVLGLAPAWKAVAYPLVRVAGGSWFLATLAIIYGACAIVFRYLKSDACRATALLVVYVACFFTAGGRSSVVSILHVERVLHMLPYFAFGLLCLRKFEFHKKWRVAVPCGVFFLSVVFLEGDVRTNGMGFYWVSAHWRTVVGDARLFLCFWARTAMGIAGSIFILWFVDNLLRRIPQLSCLAVFGTTTLGVYVVHEWPIVQIRKFCDFEPLAACWRWPLTFALFFLCHYLVMAIKANAILKFVFFGDEKWLYGIIGRIAVWRK